MAANKSNRWPMIIIGIISLVGLLSYTFVHTGNLLASYVDPQWIGFMAALGIELSIVGLSMRIGELKRSGLSYRFFAFTLIAVVVVSALANIAQGFQVKFGEALTIINWNKLDIVQVVVSIAATGLISLVTLALSEIVGQDVATAQKASQKKAVEMPVIPSPYTQEEKPAQVIDQPNNPLLEAPKDKIKVDSYKDFVIKMRDLEGNNAPQSGGDVERKFDVSHATAYRYWKMYQKEDFGNG